MKELGLFNDLTLRRVTHYLEPRKTLKITRQRRGTKRDRSATFLVTVGRPNWRETKFIKLCKKAGERFPLRKPQLTFWPRKR